MYVLLPSQNPLYEFAYLRLTQKIHYLCIRDRCRKIKVQYYKLQLGSRCQIFRKKKLLQQNTVEFKNKKINSPSFPFIRFISSLQLIQNCFKPNNDGLSKRF